MSQLVKSILQQCHSLMGLFATMSRLVTTFLQNNIRLEHALINKLELNDGRKLIILTLFNKTLLYSFSCIFHRICMEQHCFSVTGDLVCNTRQQIVARDTLEVNIKH